MSFKLTGTIATVLASGKYSKRRRSNVAVIIVRTIFISSFLFYCLLLNHSFQTNPNKITNCFKLILFYLQLYKLHLLNAFPLFLIFETARYLLSEIHTIPRCVESLLLFMDWHFPENEREHEMEVIGSAKHVVNPNCTKENKKGK